METKTRRRILELLLLCGVAASLVNLAADLIASWRWQEYSYADQTVSELSAIGAPTEPLWRVMTLPYAPLMVAFACGVWIAAGQRRSLRVTAALLLGLAGNAVLWRFFPMHTRGMETSSSDTGHIVLTAVHVVFALLAMGFSAAGFGARFRGYTIATGLTLLAAGGWTAALARDLDAGEPTPWMGLIERINVYGYLLWMAVLAVALVRELERGAEPAHRPALAVQGQSLRDW
jgi:hypothetical protein